MLSLQMKSGDYLTIGEDVIVQVFKDSNAKFRVSITAPKEIPILRGAVREREGGARPDGLRKGVLPSPSSRRYAARRMEQYMQKLEDFIRRRTDRVLSLRNQYALADRYRAVEPYYRKKKK